MPWTMADAQRHTRAVGGSAPKKKQWSTVANSVLSSGKSEGAAIRIANAAVKKAGPKKMSKPKKGARITKEERVDPDAA